MIHIRRRIIRMGLALVALLIVLIPITLVVSESPSFAYFQAPDNNPVAYWAPAFPAGIQIPPGTPLPTDCLVITQSGFAYGRAYAAIWGAQGAYGSVCTEVAVDATFKDVYGDADYQGNWCGPNQWCMVAEVNNPSFYLYDAFYGAESACYPWVNWFMDYRH